LKIQVKLFVSDFVQKEIQACSKEVVLNGKPEAAAQIITFLGQEELLQEHLR